MAFRAVLWIIEEDGCIDGVLRHNGKEYPFDPSLVMGDFEMVVSTDKDTFTKHPFTACCTNHYWEQYFIADIEKAHEISAAARKLQLVNKKSSPVARERLEGISNRFGVNVDCSRDLVDLPDDNRTTSYIPVEDLSDVGDTNYWYSYTCHSVSEMVASIWKYYFEQGYYLATCEYCGKQFARRTAKNTLCHRVQPFNNLLTGKEGEPRTCKQAVKYIREQVTRKAREIDSAIRSSETVAIKGEMNFLYEFQNKRDSYATAFRKCPSFENYRQYAEFLSRTENEKKWRVNPPL